MYRERDCIDPYNGKRCGYGGVAVRYVGVIVDTTKNVQEWNENDNIASKSFKATWDVPQIELTGVTTSPGKIHLSMTNLGKISLPETVNDGQTRDLVGITVRCPPPPEPKQPMGDQTHFVGHSDFKDNNYRRAGGTTIVTRDIQVCNGRTLIEQPSYFTYTVPGFARLGYMLHQKKSYIVTVTQP